MSLRSAPPECAPSSPELGVCRLAASSLSLFSDFNEVSEDEGSVGPSDKDIESLLTLHIDDGLQFTDEGQEVYKSSVRPRVVCGILARQQLRKQLLRQDYSRGAHALIAGLTKVKIPPQHRSMSTSSSRHSRTSSSDPSRPQGPAQLAWWSAPALQELRRWVKWAGGAGRREGVHMVHTFEEVRTRSPADPNEAAPEAIMLQAAWEALLRNAVQGLRPPYTPRTLRQWLQATQPQAWASGAPPLPHHDHTGKGKGTGKGRARGREGHSGKVARKRPR